MRIGDEHQPRQRKLVIFGTAARASFLDAVQAMSVAAHCGEMDDIHGGAGVCIGGMIIPALSQWRKTPAALAGSLSKRRSQDMKL